MERNYYIHEEIYAEIRKKGWAGWGGDHRVDGPEHSGEFVAERVVELVGDADPLGQIAGEPPHNADPTAGQGRVPVQPVFQVEQRLLDDGRLLGREGDRSGGHHQQPEFLRICAARRFGPGRSVQPRQADHFAFAQVAPRLEDARLRLLEGQ